MASIRFDKISKSYGDVPVIKNLDFSVDDGEFMVLVGPSGCGKSTALRMIAGLETITSGEVWIGDRMVNQMQPKDRDIAMVFQSYALYPHMTVYNNIAFGLKIRKTPQDEIQRRVGEAATILGLEPLLDRKPKALSGGQRQRVALGRAIVRKPSVFLFDEPLSNLDAELRVQMRSEISQLQRRLSTTTVYVTHDQVEAMTMGHRIAVMCPCPEGTKYNSNLTQCGTPMELYDRPLNVFTARFIGTPRMNMLPARIGDDGGSVELFGWRMPVAAEFAGAAKRQPGLQVSFGMRPEHIGVAHEVDWPRTCEIRGTVQLVEPLGHEVLVHMRVHDQPVTGRLRGHGRLPAAGEEFAMVMNCEAMHLFDPASEQRLTGPD
jgi:multiple sugar transport system ATP-binding protein